MNIEISNTIQTFEQENEFKKNSNKLLFGRFFANSNFVQERLLNVPNGLHQIFEIHALHWL